MSSGSVTLPVTGGSGGGGVASINGDTTSAQQIVGGTGISVATAVGVTTITNTLPSLGGTVTSVSVTTTNGVSGTVATPTTTPAISITLGAITPSSVAASGTVTGSNLSGTNTGDMTMGPFDATPNANGAVITGQVLVLEPASASFPGGVSTTTQTFAGNKTINGTLAVASTSTTALTVNTTSLVVDATNNSVGIGVAPAASIFIDALNTTGATKAVRLTSYGTGVNAGYRVYRANGTVGSPSASVANDNLGFFSARGYGTTGFGATSTGAFSYIAGETFTDSSMYTYATVQVTPTGSVTAVEAFRVDTKGDTLGPQSGSTAVHNINGGATHTTRTITANLTIDTTTSDYYILCNQSAGITITLPSPVNGRTLVIKDISGTAMTNNITVARFAAEKIEGIAASKILQTNWGAWTFITNGTDWFIV